jgi:magnesium chelatase family protein
MLAKERGLKRLFVPAGNAAEAAIIDHLLVFPVDNLRNFYYHLTGQKLVTPHPEVDFASLLEEGQEELDFADIQGQETARRVLEVAAAGGHNVAMKGPPGAGKTLMARTLPSILPRLTPEEALQVTQIYSVTGNLGERSFVTRRPFRAPHHTTSRIGLIGGGTHPTPGEISLAHRGVLFLDEFPEFPRHVLEALRQPLEDGQVTVSRAAGSLTFPASFILVAAFNPCPCGYYGSQQRPCVCPASAIAKYEKRVSGPLLDRIDLRIEVPPVAVEKIVGGKEESGKAEGSAAIRARVQKARDVQRARFAGTNLTCNAEMGTRAAKKYCEVEPAGKTLLQQAMHQLLLSARGYYKVLKVARTIADLAHEEVIKRHHLAEALQYRPQERRGF